MKTIGLIGGITWYSTAVYYRTINQLTCERLGNSHSAKLLLYSIDFSELKTLQQKDDWKRIELMISDIGIRLENAGADCILICSNTPHLIADTFKQKIRVPFIHIAEETAKEIVKQKISKVGLLGTKFTMENSFFKDHLSRLGIETMIPSGASRDLIHNSIFNEFTKGIFSTETKIKYLDIISELQIEGAEAIILGCTEISLLINQSDCKIKLFDTAAIHSKAAVDFALS